MTAAPESIADRAADAPPATRPDPAAVRIAALLVFVAVAAALLAAWLHVARTHEPWYDEFYTHYVTRPEFGWFEALSNHWLADNHPPLFYALARATGWLGDAIEARRLVNVMFAGVALAGAAFVLREDGRHRLLALIFLVFPAMAGGSVPIVAELRSYMLSLCSVALMLLALAAIWQDRAAPGRARSVVYALAVLVAFNTHVITSIVAGSLIAPFLAVALLRQHTALFRALFMPALAAGLVFLVTAAVQVPLWLSNTSEFWIPAGVGQAWGSVTFVARFIADSDRLVFLIAAAGLVVLALRAVREKRLPADLETALLLACGLAVATAIIMGIQAWRPFVIPKYLVALIPGFVMILALGYRATIATLSPMPGAALLLLLGTMSVLSIQRAASDEGHADGWEKPARAIARQMQRCSGTLVHIDSHWNEYLASLQPSDNARVVPYAYAHVAERNGFSVEPANSRRLAAGCPTLFWGQNSGDDAPTPDEVLVHVRGKGFAIDQLEYYSFGGPWIASTRPLDRDVIGED